MNFVLFIRWENDSKETRRSLFYMGIIREPVHATTLRIPSERAANLTNSCQITCMNGFPEKNYLSNLL